MSLRAIPLQAEGSWASDEATRRVMVATRGRDTRPEKACAAPFTRWDEIQGRDTGHRGRDPGPTDLVFTRARVAVFVDGCFWHVCPEHGDQPRINTNYWRPKLAANVARDRRVDGALRQEGWEVVRVWEHETPADAAERVRLAVAGRRSTGAGSAEVRLPRSELTPVGLHKVDSRALP